MIINVIGLGLIGGSLCKAIKEKTKYIVYGYDNDTQVCQKAINNNAIDRISNTDCFADADMTILCLYPKDCIDFVNKNIKNLKNQSIVLDFCGIKEKLLCLEKILRDKNIFYVGCHPMAGREFSGFEYSMANLFENSSFIISKTDETDNNAIETIKDLAKQVGFENISITNAKAHDKNIAFTSQLAHIISNAYVKSPTAQEYYGFSAGSFQDLTRVAKLNPKMWTELFLDNSENLVFEIDFLVNSLNKYRNALKENDEKALYSLLKKGSDLKEKL